MIKKPIITLHHGDLPADCSFEGDIAVDTEAMGLNILRDKLCLVQLTDGAGTIHLVKFDITKHYHAPHLCALLGDTQRQKIYHFARFDLAMIYHYLGVMATPVFCTRTASRLVRTYTANHGLKDLCQEYLSINLDKQQQCSDWGHHTLSDEQCHYAMQDVAYLHQLRDHCQHKLDVLQRLELAQACFDFLPHRALLDIKGWDNIDIFNHS